VKDAGLPRTVNSINGHIYMGGCII